MHENYVCGARYNRDFIIFKLRVEPCSHFLPLQRLEHVVLLRQRPKGLSHGGRRRL